IASLIRRPLGLGPVQMYDERIAGIQRLVAELKIHLAAKIASTGSSDDFSTTVTDAAVFGAEGAVADANLLNLIFWRDSPTGESIDYEGGITTGSAACSGDLLEVCGKFVLIVGHRVNEVAAENGGAQARRGIDAQFRSGLCACHILGIGS